MSHHVRILLADRQASSSIGIEDFLVKRGYVVEHYSDGRSALRALDRAYLTGNAFDLVVAAEYLGNLSPWELFEAVRLRDRNAGLVLLLTRPLDGAQHQQAERLGVRIYRAPVEPQDLEQAVRDAAWAADQRRSRPGTGTFFGTSTAAFSKPATSPFPAQGSSPALEPSRRFTQPSETSTRIRRSVTGRNEQPPASAIPADSTQGSSQALEPSQRFTQPSETSTRIRRSITGRNERPPTSAIPAEVPPTQTAQRMVACALCNKAFLVPARPEAFTVMCIHCGQANRILPLG